MGFCPFSCNKQICVSIVGLSLSLTELVLASVYNFHFLGFGFSIIGIITSSLQLHFNVKDQKARHGSATNDLNESSEHNDSPLRVSTNKLQRVQVHEEQRKNQKLGKTLWIVYTIFVVFIGALVIVRLFSLFRRISWRKALDGDFPSECGSWAESNGCTRVVLEKDGCTRPDGIETDNNIIFQVDGVDRLLNTQIAQCADEIIGAKLQSPGDLKSLGLSNELIHITFNSAIWGFIDDLYMITEPYTMPGSTEEDMQRVVKFQSQLRIGSYDFSQNYDHVKKMVNCLDSTFDSFSSDVMPCSVTD